MSLVAAPFLLDNPKVGELFPKDAIARARKVLSLFKGGVGAYTDSRGSAGVRREVADFISKRDGYPSNPEVSPPSRQMP
jgi:glutamate--glyoxylate aminotransferase